MNRPVITFMVTLILAGTLFVTCEVQPVWASGTIYIRADGSIDPSSAHITSPDNVTYTFTDNNYASMIIERDNIVVNGQGYTLQGTGAIDSRGMDLTGRTNVTVTGARISNFWDGIWLNYTAACSLSGNIVTSNGCFGIALYNSLGGNVWGNSVANNFEGLVVMCSPYCTLSGNNVTDNDYGISLGGDSAYCVVFDNNVTNGTMGIGLSYSPYSTLSGNAITGSQEAVYIYGSYLSHYLHSIDSSNLVDGKPVYYFTNQSDLTVDADAYPDVGFLGFANCANVTVDGLNLTSRLLVAYSKDSRITGNSITDSVIGIFLFASSNCSLSRNNVTNNDEGIVISASDNNILSNNNVTANSWDGISLVHSDNNTLFGNTVMANSKRGIDLEWFSAYNVVSGNNIVANNEYGVRVDYAGYNILCHNNFIDNVQQVGVVYVYLGPNHWDGGYPFGGNYWTDYTGIDVHCGPDQDQPGSDGIGDTPYVIDSENQDRYPLMKPYPWSSYGIGITYLGMSKTAVGRGYTVQGSAMIFNYGDDTEYFNITVHALLSEPTPVMFGIHTSVNLSLASRAFSTLTFTWDTTGFAYGNYTISCLPEVGDEVAVAFADGWVVVTLPGDVDGDTDVDIFDIVRLAGGYGTTPPNPKYDPNCDIDGDGDIDIFDLVLAAGNYGKHW